MAFTDVNLQKIFGEHAPGPSGAEFPNLFCFGAEFQILEYVWSRIKTLKYKL